MRLGDPGGPSTQDIPEFQSCVCREERTGYLTVILNLAGVTPYAKEC